MQKFLLKVTISADGSTVVGETSGINGKKCSDIAALLDHIGEELEHRHTADYDKPEPVQITGPVTGTLSVGGG